VNKQLEEIEGHFHTPVGIEAATVPTAATVFSITSGAGGGSYGAWTCVLGSGDTPCATLPGQTHYDLHKIGIYTSVTGLHYIQFGFGTVAAGVLTGVYTTIWYNAVASTGKTESIAFNSMRRTCGTKVFARCITPGQNSKVVTFNFAAHFYLL
jgi:hypothetical protein